MITLKLYTCFRSAGRLPQFNSHTSIERKQIQLTNYNREKHIKYNKETRKQHNTEVQHKQTTIQQKKETD